MDLVGFLFYPATGNNPPCPARWLPRLNKPHTFPDAPEQRPIRNSSFQISLGHRVNAAMAQGDQEGTDRAFAEWTQL